MPELPSEPPQLVASVSSEMGCLVLRASLARGKISRTAAAAVSTVFRIPPASWMLTMNGRRSGCPGTAMRCLSTMTAAWFTSQPSPTRI